MAPVKVPSPGYENVKGADVAVTQDYDVLETEKEHESSPVYDVIGEAPKGVSSSNEYDVIEDIEATHIYDELKCKESPIYESVM